MAWGFKRREKTPQASPVRQKAKPAEPEQSVLAMFLTIIRSRPVPVRPTIEEVQKAEAERQAEERRRNQAELAHRLAQGSGAYFPTSARSDADRILLGYDEGSRSNYGDRR